MDKSKSLSFDKYKPKKPVSTEKPVTVKPTEKQTEKPKNEVSFEIECKKILKKKELWKNGLEEVIPASGIYYSGKCSFTGRRVRV